MKNSWIIKSLSFSLFPLFLSVGHAATEQAFPEEDLARESVLPVFDVPNSVRNRNVALSKKIELGLFGGWTTDEAIYNGGQVGGIVSYHFDEVHGINLMFAKYNTGLSSYSDQLKDPKNGNLDFSKTFAPQSFYFLNYQAMGYYGKLSLLKNYNMNFHVFGTAGLGSIVYNGLQEMAVDFGIGQRIYFTKNFGVKIEYRFARYNGPNPVSVADKNKLKQGTLGISDYSSVTYFQNQITVGLVLLL